MTQRNDMPDDYPWLAGSNRSSLADLGELAARLGSPLIYDRRGEVVFADTFQYGVSPYNNFVLGTGAEILVVADDVDIGRYALQLTAGSSGARQAGVRRYFSPTSLQKIGFEVSAAFMSTGFESILLDLGRYDGTSLHWASIKILKTSVQQYRASDGSFQDFASETVWFTDSPIYHNLKLVVDLDNDEYVRFLYDEVEYDLKNISSYILASGVQPQHVVQFVLQSETGQNDVVKLGRFIITGNEQ